MRRTVVRVLAVTALAAQTACGILGDGTRPCTMIYSPAGISVEVAPELSAGATASSLTVCWDAVCRRGVPRPRELAPQVRPWPGFTAVDDLPGRPVRVTLRLTDAEGGTVLERRTTLTPRATYANGRHCAPGGPQAHLAVTADGALITG
ncbi:hypothetical protein [Streptomyces sp. enrichment culture]|uniref:hypothetical protein n=1 Tax=Streptomyces sp. enrichment culture TaxID=1795815 RepID=UPI003F546C0B